MEHTPGPWYRVHRHPDLETRLSVAYITSNGRSAYDEIATVYGCDRRPEQAANATLIAMAPDLLSCLESIEAELSRLGFGGDDDISGAECVDAMSALLPLITRATAAARGG